MAGSNGNGSNGNGAKVGTDKVKQGLAQMLKGGVIVSCDRCVIVLICLMDVCTSARCRLVATFGDCN